MNKHKALLLLSLTGFLTLTSPSVTADAAWQTTSSGTIYTQSAAPGYLTGLNKIDGKWYFFSSKGIMQTGFVTIDKKTYYFNKSGVMLTGFHTINDATYFFNSSGVLIKGWFSVSGKKYFALTNGQVVKGQWLNNYYFQADGSLATNTWINGKWVGSNGKYTGVQKKVGWITENGKTYYYDKNSKLVKGWVTVDKKKYYLHPTTGVLQTGWITVKGKKYYASADQNGAILTSQWYKGKYLGKSGAMATGWTTISGKTYYLSSSGTRQTGWVQYNDKYYYFNKKGVLQTNAWIDNMYVGEDGARMSGLVTIGKYTYYLNPKTGKIKTGFVSINGKRYYFSKAGRLQKSKWVSSNNYYANSSGIIVTGLSSVQGNLYYFDSKTGKKLTSSFKTIGSDTYYFKKDGAAAKNIWVKYNDKYYYFQSTGKMAVSAWVGKYYVDADGVRTSTVKTTGWQTIGENRYYFNSSGEMSTGFQTIDGSTYYFDSKGIMQTGLQTINNTKYYFYTDGTMAADTTIDVGTKQYTINSSGVITSETSIKISENNTGTKIVNYALKFVGNPYVYGGTSLTKGADCSGFTMSVFAHFGYTLLRVANDQMNGPSSAYIAKGYAQAVTVDISDIQPGDLIFYGYGNYASHVAIYIGDGQIVHASNSQPYPQGGIKISNYDYQTPLKVVRYWTD
jgi:glucan-binding repeat-containing protein